MSSRTSLATEEDPVYSNKSFTTPKEKDNIKERRKKSEGIYWFDTIHKARTKERRIFQASAFIV